MRSVAPQSVAEVDHRPRSACGERTPGGDSGTRLQLTAAQFIGDLGPDDVRQLGAIQHQQPGRRAAELAGDSQYVAGIGA